MVRARRSTGQVTSTFVLRLLAVDPATGRLIGRVDAVGSGHECVTRSLDDLVAFLAAELAGSHSDDTGQAGASGPT